MMVEKVHIKRGDSANIQTENNQAIITVPTFDTALKIKNMFNETSIEVIFSNNWSNCQTVPKSLLFNIESLHKACVETIRYAKNKSLNISICIMDSGGHQTYFYRMPDAILISISMAKKKAKTALFLNVPTSSIQKLSQPGATLYNIEAMSNGELVTFGGGIPIYDLNKEILGAIGVSGASNPSDDEELACYFVKQLYNYC